MVSAHSSEPYKLTLQLTAEAGELQVRAESALGEAHHESPLPTGDLLNELSASIPHPRPVLEKIGRDLRQVMLAGEVNQLFQTFMAQAQHTGEQVHLELRFDPDQVALARYPWELLASEYGDFPVQQGQIDLSRYITFPQAPPSFGAGFSGRAFLQVIPQPQDLPPLQVGKLPIQPLRVLSHASFDDFERVLLMERQPVWGLQFDGHGCLVKVCPNCGTYAAAGQLACGHCRQRLPENGDWRGALAFERGGLMDAVPVREIGAALYNAGVQLVLLFACESGTVSGRQVFNGVAPGLLLAGVPVVVGMQYAIPDAFASQFAAAFYRSLNEKAGVLAAVRQARRLDTTGGWYSPVVYQRWQPLPHEAQRRSAFYHLRHIDAAAPGQVQAGRPFLTRLWIRRPETPPASEADLRRDLDVPPGVSLHSASTAANLKFEPLPGEQEHPLRRGAVEVRLEGMGCEVIPASIPLFVDESLDAPPGIFTVTCRRTGSLTLVFTVWQEGAQVAALPQPIEALDHLPETGAALKRSSRVVPVEGHPTEIELQSPSIECPNCGQAVLTGSRFCPNCGRSILSDAKDDTTRDWRRQHRDKDDRADERWDDYIGRDRIDDRKEDKPRIEARRVSTGPENPHESHTGWQVIISHPFSSILLSPGEQGSSTLTVSNQGSQVEAARLILRGEAAEWAACITSPFQLMPGETFPADLMIAPPYDIPPGTYLLQIEAVSENQPDEDFVTESFEIVVRGVSEAPEASGCLSTLLHRLFSTSLLLLLLTYMFRARAKQKL